MTPNTAKNGCATVAIVIPNWNGAARLANLLERLSRQTYSIGRVIVVDNGSSDESLAVAKNAGATLIELGSNTGLKAPSMQLAAGAAPGDVEMAVSIRRCGISHAKSTSRR